jgi:hypothetical protein
MLCAILIWNSFSCIVELYIVELGLGCDTVTSEWWTLVCAFFTISFICSDVVFLQWSTILYC